MVVRVEFTKTFDGTVRKHFLCIFIQPLVRPIFFVCEGRCTTTEENFHELNLPHCRYISLFQSICHIASVVTHSPTPPDIIFIHLFQDCSTGWSPARVSMHVNICNWNGFSHIQ